MQDWVASVLSCAPTSRRCSKGNWRTRFSASVLAMCDSKARARHGLKRLLCCCGQHSAMGSSLPGPWGASASESGCHQLLLLEEKKKLLQK